MNQRWNRYSLEARYLLDLVAWALHSQCQGIPLGIRAGTGELYEDLRNRLANSHVLPVNDVPLSVGEGAVYLFPDQEHLDHLRMQDAPFVLVAFRNQRSLKSLKYGIGSSLTCREVLGLLRQAGFDVRYWGVFGPQHLLTLILAGWADRLGRFDWGFFLRDRAVLSPVMRGERARWANYVVALGVRQ